MRSRITIFILTFVIVFAMAGSRVSFFGEQKNDTDSSVAKDTTTAMPVMESSKAVAALDSAAIQAVDTLDSLHRAIYLRNKAIDDSLSLDSMNRKRKNGIDAPVAYTADDSLVYFAGNKMAHLYGSSTVKYENMDLASEKVAITLDSSLVRATGVIDSATKEKIGTPVFKMGSDTYESDTMAFNFKTKKGLIAQVYTEQEDGFLTAERSKRDNEGNLYLKHGRYTTCDDEHPDFYLALSRAKVRPGKDVIFGPAYLVVQDVPLPLAIPYGFFPFSKSYSSGFIMPTYGDESARGFYLRDGGYYFAISDRMDLKLLGEIYTKGSWGLSATTNYRKRYRYSGSFYASYQDTREGDKGLADYTKNTSFKITWSHRQDAKASPYGQFSASVNFSTSSYERNNLSSMYNPVQRSQSTRTSSVSYSTQFSSIGMSITSSANIEQRMQDSTLRVTLPDLNINISRFSPFKRRKLVGKERWYEKISMSYTGHISHSISAKEDEVLKGSFINGWDNDISHSIPVSATFSLFNAINVTPSVNFSDRMYTQKTVKEWVGGADGEVRDRLTPKYGLFNVYDVSVSATANTKLYGMFIPNRKIFGDKIQAIRHVFTPSVSYSYKPNLTFNDELVIPVDVFGGARATDSICVYNPFGGSITGTESKSINFSVSNNLEMKVRSDKDSTGVRKVSIIDELGARMSYNFAAKSHQWSDLNMNIRLKLTKSYTFSLNANFATYAYHLKRDKDGKEITYLSDETEYHYGRFGRFQGMSQNFSYTLNPETIAKLFGKGGDKKKGRGDKSDDDDDDTDNDTNSDPVMKKGQKAVENKNMRAETDEDGYMRFSMPWSLTFSYGVTLRENTGGKFGSRRLVSVEENGDSIYIGRYNYSISQNLNFSGNIRLSQGWNISFTSGYDFNYHKLSMTTASLRRDLHCFSMSCSVVIAPYTSYNFSFRCNAATLTDALKYDKRSGYSNNVKWY